MIGIAAPAWSQRGLALRMAAPIIGSTLYASELQIAPFTASGVETKLTADATELRYAGHYRVEWQRYPIDVAMLEKAKTSGLVLRAECQGIGGDWTYNIPAGYFRGYAKQVDEIAAVERLRRVSEHQPAERSPARETR